MPRTEKQTEKRLAKITETYLGIEDHGIFGFSVGLDYGDSHQAFGFYGLGHTDREREEWIPSPQGLKAIRGIIDACGVDRWEKLKGRTVFAIIEDGWVRGLEPLPTERGKRFHVHDIWPKD